MNEKPTWWEYLTAYTAYGLYIVWAMYEHQKDPSTIPFEPIIAAVTTGLAIWGYLRWKQNKADAASQTAEKIYNVGSIQKAEFGTSIQDSENAVVDSTITANSVNIGHKNIQTNIEKQTIVNYADGRKIPRFLTNSPFNSEYFIGREKDLEAIENDYQQNKDRLLVLVNGEGGMGKTTLAAKYWGKYQSRYKHLAWLYVDRGIGAALVGLAAPLAVQFDQTDDEAQQIARITAAINNLEMPCLFVLDNANDEKDLEQHYATLRKLSNCHILLTSRTKGVGGMNVHRVLPLDKDSAIKVFKHYYPKLADTDLPLLHDILKAVGYNTLVIEVLAKNLAVFNRYQTKYSLGDLLADLQKKGLLALKNKAVKIMYGSDSLRTAEPTDIIGAMYDLATLTDAEQYLLSNLAVLPAENIPYAVLQDLLKIDEEDRFDTPLRMLEEKGWIEYRETDNSFKISPVIQEITKSKNAERLMTDCATLIDTLTDGLNEENRHNDNYKQATAYAILGESVAFSIPFADYDVAVLCQNIGNFYKDTGNLSLMMQAYQKMVDIYTDLCKAAPDNADFKNGLAISYSKLGETHSSLGSLDQALGFFEEYNRLEKELHTAYPNKVSFKNSLAISYQYLGNTHSSLGNLDQALGFFEEYNRLSKELYIAYPNNVDFKNGLAISYEKLGKTHSSLGDLEQALGFFEKDLELSKELYTAYPNNVSFKNNLAISYNYIGNTHSSLGNIEKALKNYEEYNRLSKELYESNNHNVKFKNDYAISYEKLGKTHSSMGNLDQALVFFEDEKKLFEELYAAYPNNVSFKNGLAISYSKLGDTHSSLGNLDQALGFFEEYNRLEKELYAAYPNNVDFKNGLAISYAKLGDTHSSLGNLDQALGFFEEQNKLVTGLSQAKNFEFYK